MIHVQHCLNHLPFITQREILICVLNKTGVGKSWHCELTGHTSCQPRICLNRGPNQNGVGLLCKCSNFTGIIWLWKSFQGCTANSPQACSILVIYTLGKNANYMWGFFSGTDLTIIIVTQVMPLNFLKERMFISDLRWSQQFRIFKHEGNSKFQFQKVQFFSVVCQYFVNGVTI